MFKHGKRLLAWLMILFMVVSMIPNTAIDAFATEAETETAVEATTAVSDEEAEEEIEAVKTTETIQKETGKEDAEEAEEITDETSETVSETEEETTIAQEEEPSAETDLSGIELTQDDDLSGINDSKAVSVTKTKSVPLDGSTFYRIFHLDAGRKYFSPAQIYAIIDQLAANNYTHLELALGNDALRFLLDDMSVSANGKTYASDTVAAGIQAGNKAYYDDPNGNYLTESEMNRIISYAKSKNISLIPLINTPGHMDAILGCMEAVGISNPAYNNSARTVDVTKAEAVNFTLALVNKYIKYFADKGVKIFNMGCDEYANDKYGDGSMGFGNLISKGQYGSFITYVNNMAAQVQNAGMTAMAFNDGIYFNNSKSYGTIDTDIAVAYWTSGWKGYSVRSAANLVTDGFKIINTNDAWYYVLGRTTGDTYSLVTAKNGVSKTKVTSVSGSTNVMPSGSMACLWCDTPSAAYSSAEVSNLNYLIKTLAESNPDYFVSSQSTAPVYEMSAANNRVMINTMETGVELTSVTATPASVKSITGKHIAYDVKINNGTYTGKADVTITLEDNLKDAKNLTGFVVESDGTLTKVKGSLKDGKYTFTAPHFSVTGVMEEEPTRNLEEKTINLTVGESKTDVQEGSFEPGSHPTDNPSIATANVTLGQDAGTPAKSPDKVTNPTTGTYIIGNGSRWITLNSNGQIGSTADDKQATEFTVTRSGSNNNPTYTLQANGYYLNCESSGSVLNRTYSLTSSKTGTRTSWSSGSNGLYYSYFIYQYYIRYNNNGWGLAQSVNANSSAFAYTPGTEAIPGGDITTATFTGLSPGTTHVTIGNVRYTIIVSDAVPSDANKDANLTIEYWITNNQVRSKTTNATSVTIPSSAANSEKGVAITPTYAPTEGLHGNITVYYWQTMRLDSAHKQTTEGQDDETANGITFTRVRYHNAWQYMTADGVWNYFANNDQAVAYYLQKTEVTKEITTYMKDWGNTSASGGDDNDKVALSVAVVYPDGTVSPTSPYPESSVWFNYWDNRDIGIVAPINNGDYEISKITYTNGRRYETRDGKDYYVNTGGKWKTTDKVWWERKTTASGTTWYNETVVWDDSRDTTPMVNGKASNIIWPARNTGVLILIYLKPIHKDTNLTVQWVDDSTASTITSQEVVVDSTSQTSTFFNSLKQTSSVQAGTITLDDNAYVTNSSGVNQTFNKDLTTMQNIPGQYTSGLYKYQSAEISDDGMILTLHYKLDDTQLKHTYVVDFGLPVVISLNDLGVSQTNNVKNVITTNNATYQDGNKTITFTPSQVLKTTETVAVTIEYKNGTSTDTIQLGFMPATTVYYEEGFASYTGTWINTGSKGSGVQATQVAGQSTDEYGYDKKYADEETGASNRTQATTTTKGSSASFTFTGTGIDVYANCKKNTGVAIVRILDANGNNEKSVIVNTNTKQDIDLINSNITEYGLPILSLNNLAHGKHTVQITSATNSELTIDGFRVYGTLADEKTNALYKEDLEEDPSYVEIRSKVLAAADITPSSDMKSQVDAVIGDNDAGRAVVISSSAVITSETAQQLLENGPKNELFLAKGQSLVFSVTTDKEVQLGMKAVTGSVTVSGTINKTITSSTDMFYTVKESNASNKTITITNNSEELLSITKVKVCDDPSFALGKLKTEDLDDALISLGLKEKDAQAGEDPADLPDVTEDTGEDTTSGEATTEESKPTEPVLPSVKITSQPKDVKAVVGQKASLSVKADGSKLKYQWQKYDASKKTYVNIAKATLANYKFTAAASSQGSYRCIVTDAAGEKVISKTVKVKVTLKLISQSKSTSVKKNKVVTFKVQADGYKLSYTWQVKKSGKWVTASYSGKNTANMKVKANKKLNKMQFRCLIKDGNGNSVTTKTITLKVK